MRAVATAQKDGTLTAVRLEHWAPLPPSLWASFRHALPGGGPVPAPPAHPPEVQVALDAAHEQAAVVLEHPHATCVSAPRLDDRTRGLLRLAGFRSVAPLDLAPGSDERRVHTLPPGEPAGRGGYHAPDHWRREAGWTTLEASSLDEAMRLMVETADWYPRATCACVVWAREGASRDALPDGPRFNVRFTSGAAAGTTRAAVAVSPTTLALDRPLPRAPGAGDVLLLAGDPPIEATLPDALKSLAGGFRGVATIQLEAGVYALPEDEAT